MALRGFQIFELLGRDYSVQRIVTRDSVLKQRKGKIKYLEELCSDSITATCNGNNMAVGTKLLLNKNLCSLICVPN